MKKKVFVGLRGGIGDIVVITGLLKDLRQKYPDDKYEMICGTSFSCEKLIRSIPYFDDVVVDYRPRYARHVHGRFFYKDKRNGLVIDPIDHYFCLSHPYRDASSAVANEVHIVDMAARIFGLRSYRREGMVFPPHESVTRALHELRHFPRPVIIAPLSSQQSKIPSFGLINRIVKEIDALGFNCVKIVPPGNDRLDSIECPFVCMESIMDVVALVGLGRYFVGLDSGMSHIAAAHNLPMSTIHIEYSAHRSGVLSNKANILEFPSKSIPLTAWPRIVSSITTDLQLNARGE